MRILKVIHGYPMLYNAGSEVYSQTICHALADRGHEVHVFTREEDSFRPDGSIRQDVDQDKPSIQIHLVNNPRHRDRYRLSVIDQRFAELLDRIQPDVVHIGHLNHLSTSLVFEAKHRNLPVVYTLHDYWLMCPVFFKLVGTDS
jgi:glycosyltransferase involved in cell wall biosynthesis